MKKLLGVLAVLGLFLFSSTVMAVNLQWDTRDPIDCNGFYLYWYLPNATPEAKVEITPGTATTGTIAESNFTENVIYNIHATAWANPVNSTDPKLESLKSNVIQYRKNPSGGNNTVPPGTPTALGLTGTNFSWVAPASASGVPNPVGYNVYYKLGTATNWSSPTMVMSAITVPIATVNSNWTNNVLYNIKVKAFVYGLDGIALLEGGDSNIFNFTPGGGTGQVPSAPKGLKLGN